jgi:hypothetical protein
MRIKTSTITVSNGHLKIDTEYPYTNTAIYIKAPGKLLAAEDIFVSPPM